MATTWGAATMGQKLSAIGKSNADLMGGAMLAMDGLRRGGFTGLAETTAGGGLIGFKYGGPLGAAIGAGIGAIAGTIRLFVKGAQEKAREKIKAPTGQKPTGLPGTARPATLAQTGGSLYQQFGYSNGSPLPSSAGLPTADSIGAGTAPHAGSTVIQLDGPATTALLRGRRSRPLPRIRGWCSARRWPPRARAPGAGRWWRCS